MRIDLLLATLLCASCVSAEPAPAAPPIEELYLQRFEPSIPEWVPAGSLDVVVALAHRQRNTLGSATILAPDLLLTADHVRRSLGLEPGAWTRIEVDGREVGVRAEAHGDAAFPHGDWALLRLEEPRFHARARIHPAAREPGWKPTPGTELVLAGFAQGFFEERRVRVDAPTPAITAAAVEAPESLEHPSWYARGAQVDLRGMSGGAVLTQGEADRPELLGVVVSMQTMRKTELRQWRLLGLPLTSEREDHFYGLFQIHRLPSEVLALAP